MRKGEELGEEFVQLSILGLHIGDSGAYTCKVGSYSNSSATVHVVNGMFSYKRKVYNDYAITWNSDGLIVPI